MVRQQAREHVAHVQRVDRFVAVHMRVAALPQLLQQLSIAAGATPVVDQLVAGGADQPRHVHLAAGLAGADGGEEGLGGEVLGGCRAVAAANEVAVDVWQRLVVQL